MKLDRIIIFSTRGDYHSLTLKHCALLMATVRTNLEDKNGIFKKIYESMCIKYNAKFIEMFSLTRELEIVENLF